jgi:FtsH-binding integral membrane protein
MSDYDRGFARQTSAAAPDMAVDAGLRGFMLGVYNKVGLGLVLSAALAWVTGNYPPAEAILFRVDSFGRIAMTPIGWIVGIAPIGILLFQRFARRASPESAAFTYWAVVSLIGASLGIWFLAYAGAAIYQAFLITAIAFGSLSLLGYTTKRDLSGMGSFMMMGLVGIILAMILNFFIHSGPLAFAINVIGVLIFAGLTAWDTQRLKLMYYQLGGDQAAMSVATSYGALNLYLDFINMFQFVLSLMGGSRR